MKGIRVAILLLSLALIGLTASALTLFPSVFPTRGPMIIGSDQATSSVAIATSGSASIQVFSNSNVYSCGDIVFLTAEIAGSPSLFGVTVQFQVYEPGGLLMLNGASQTNSNGQATYQFTLPANCLTGTYNVYAFFSNLGSTVSSNVGFTVQSTTITTATSNVTSTSTSLSTSTSALSTSTSTSTTLSTSVSTSTSLSTSTSTSTTLSTSTSTSTTLSTSTSTSTALLTSTSVLTTSVVATVTTAIAFSTTSTVESNVPVYVLANPLAESAVLVAAVVSLLSVAFVIRARRSVKSAICPNCGHANPPHASKFCVNCGKTLRK